MWDTLILNPMINALLLLYDLVGGNFIVAISIFTIIIRLLTLPLNLRQQRSSLKMQEMQPQIQAIQKKHKDNPQKMQEEFAKIGYNPAETLAGCLPLVIQFPILIGLYQAILVMLGSTPQSLFELTQRAYPGVDLTGLLPIDNTFVWLNLAQPDPLYILPVLVFATMFLQQKLLMPAPPASGDNSDNPAAAMTQSMLYTMPIMFGFFSLQFPAGLSIYFVLVNIIGIGQGFYMKRSMAAEKERRAALKGSNGETDDTGTDDDTSSNGRDDSGKSNSQKSEGSSKSKKKSKRKKRR
ncbi:MAG: YidC/Oxa1 family membrane protein insertase [Chloroflexota bacterium]